ncbi:MAG: hypothetical protein WBB42_03350 [Polyangiales bacterium]
MGERGSLYWVAMVCVLLAGCEETKPRLERIEVTAAHRACEEGDACGVVETSCTSQGCRCGVAVNEKHVLDYQKQLAECRGQEELATCDFVCETPFGKCFKGACVLTSEPSELFRGGRSVQALCEGSRGTYVGCPQCAPNERCKSCMPCECPSSHRWTKKGCRAVVQTEARDILVETRPSVVNHSDDVKARVHNNSKRTIWLKTVCGTPFYRLRKKEDSWEKDYEPFHEVKCRLGSVEIAPGKNRPFVIDNLDKFREPSGEAATPGTFRFELTYTDSNESFRHSAIVYSTQFDLAEKLSRR